MDLFYTEALAATKEYSLTNTLTNIKKSTGGRSGQGSDFYLHKVESKVPERTQQQSYDVPMHLHMLEVT